MQFEQLASGFGAIEAPRMDARGQLYFSDIIFHELHKRDAAGNIHRLLRDRVNIGGIAFNQDGRLIISGRGGLALFDEATGELEPLLTHIEGEPIDVINDIHVDDEGGIYAGTLDLANLMASRPALPGTLFRLDPSRKLTVINREIGISNGIGFSPDRRHFYHSDTATGIWQYPLEAGRAAGARRLFAAHPGSDGMAVDAEGGVWVACADRGGIVRYAPDGSLERRLDIPAKAVLSVVFAGVDLRDLYVVTADDFHNPVERAGAIFRARSDIPGQALPLAQF